MTGDLLIVMNPREIGECVWSIAALEIDKAWAVGYSQLDLEPVVDEIVETTGYERYIAVSDDVVVLPSALRAVLRAAEQESDAVVTGWTNLDMTPEGARKSSVVRTPFTEHASVKEQYDWMPIAEVLDGPELFRTPFAGMCLTCMTRDRWLEFPFRVLTGRGRSHGTGSSDFELSWRLQQAGVPIYAVRDAQVFHVKELTTHQDVESRKALRWLGEDAHVRWDLFAEDP